MLCRMMPTLCRSRLRDAAARFDVLVTTGGASRGEEDHVVKTLDTLGKLRMWQLAIKPGRPMAFGQIGDCVVLGLPGNPVAVFVCFLLYAQPLIAASVAADGASHAVFACLLRFRSESEKPAVVNSGAPGSWKAPMANSRSRNSNVTAQAS